MTNLVNKMKKKVEDAGITITSIDICRFNEYDPSINCGKWDIQLCSRGNKVSLLDTSAMLYHDLIHIDEAIKLIKGE